MKAVSNQLKLQVSDDASVTATVGIGMRPEGVVDLAVALPGLVEADSQRLIDMAHQVFPYSNATRNNVNVRLSIV